MTFPTYQNMKKGTEQTLTYGSRAAGREYLSLWTTGIAAGKGGADLDCQQESIEGSLIGDDVKNQDERYSMMADIASRIA